MISNCIFDFGQVIVHFLPRELTRPYVNNEEDLDLVTAVAFDRLYWNRLDQGTISDAEILAAFRTRLPERLWDAAEQAYLRSIGNLTPLDGMPELLRDLKKAGKKLYLLSNISTIFAQTYRNYPQLADVLAPFDGLVFSGPLHVTKPSPAIFNHLTDTYGLNKAESVFIDDNADNVAGAEAVGLPAYHFDGDVQKLRAFLLG